MGDWPFQFLRVVVEVTLWMVTTALGRLVQGILEHPEGIVLGFAIGVPVVIARLIKS